MSFKVPIIAQLATCGVMPMAMDWKTPHDGHVISLGRLGPAYVSVNLAQPTNRTDTNYRLAGTSTVHINFKLISIVTAT